jgi:hypothetical protein
VCPVSDLRANLRPPSRPQVLRFAGFPHYNKDCKHTFFFLSSPAWGYPTRTGPPSSIAPTQLVPNGWRIIVGFLALYRRAAFARGVPALRISLCTPPASCARTRGLHRGHLRVCAHAGGQDACPAARLLLRGARPLRHSADSGHAQQVRIMPGFLAHASLSTCRPRSRCSGASSCCPSPCKVRKKAGTFSDPGTGTAPVCASRDAHSS